MQEPPPTSLVFSLPPDAREAFENAVFNSTEARAGRASGGTCRRVWLDTSGEALRRAELSLSLRMDGRRRSLRPLRWPDERISGWREIPCQDAVAGCDALPPAFLIRAGEAFKARDLAPTFDRALAWRERSFRQGNTTISARIEHGDVGAGARRLPLCHVVLQARTGGLDDLFSFARSLRARSRLRPDFTGSALKGFLIADGVWGRSGIKWPIRIDARMNAGEACEEILWGGLRQLSLELAAFGQGADSDAIHQTRVALRRLRASLALFQPFLRDPEFERLRAELRSLFTALGEARDLDVMLERLASGAPGAPTFEPVSLADIERRRDAAQRAARDELASTRCDDLLFDLAQFARAGAWRRCRDADQARLRGLAVGDFAARRTRRRRDDLSDLVERFDDLDSDGLHDLRKRTKTLRYFSEFLEPLATREKARERFQQGVRALSELQETLGKVHDIDALETFVEAGEQLNVPAAATAERRARLVRKGRRQAKKAAKAKPFLKRD